MKFRFLMHVGRAMALIALVAVVAVLSVGNMAWARQTDDKGKDDCTGRSSGPCKDDDKDKDKDKDKCKGRSTVPCKEADLSITKTAKSVGSHSDDFIFTITVKNNSKIAAEDVVVTDQLSKHFELEYARSKTNGVTCNDDQTVKCKLGTLGAGKTATIEIRVDVEPNNFRGWITNTATVSSKTKDPNSKNNKSSVKVQAKGKK